MENFSTLAIFYMKISLKNRLGKNTLLTAIGAAFSVFLYAQQDPQFSQNMHNRLFPNPGVAGSNNAICGTLLGRQQWMGFPGQPKTYLLSIHAPVKLIHGGVGLSVSQDELGQQKTFGLKGAYAYRMFVGLGELGIGAALGMVNVSLGNEWKATDGVAGDNSIPQNGAGKTGFDMDFGAYYKTPDLFFGISTTHINESELKDQTFNYKVARHYYIMAGYTYNLKSIPLAIQPMIFAKSDAASTQIDANLVAMYNNLIWLGASYRVQDAIVLMAGIQKDIGPGTMKFGYSYDVTTSVLKKYSSGSHELMLGYCLNMPDDTQKGKHKTVRFL